MDGLLSRPDTESALSTETQHKASTYFSFDSDIVY